MWSRRRDGQQSCTDAVLDVVATRPHTADALYIDVTVRNPLMDRYLRGERGSSSSNTSGFACDCALRDKRKRYPSTNGLVCTPFALEVFGRISPECVLLLETLAGDAASHDVSRAMPPRAWKRTWLQKLAVTVQRSMARSILTGIGSRMHI